MYIEQVDFVIWYFIGFYVGDYGGIDIVVCIVNVDVYLIVVFVNVDCYYVFVFIGLNIVNDGIFYQWLDKQVWDYVVDVVVNIVDDCQFVVELCLFNSDIIFDLIQFLFDINLFIVF